jgi:hypothetical protein
MRRVVGEVEAALQREAAILCIGEAVVSRTHQAVQFSGHRSLALQLSDVGQPLQLR